MQQIADWLEKLGMSEYAQRFAENRVDFSVLPDLTDQDLKDLGVVLGDRRKMLRAIAKLDTMPEAVTLMPMPASTLSVAREQPVRVAEPSEHHHVTVMYCDLVDSTDIGAKVDVEERRDLVGACLDAASAAVTEMGGEVAKKLRCGLIALFGYPAAQENNSERAVRAALATHRALAELNRMNADISGPAVAARTTIDCGPVAIDAAGRILGEVPSIVAQAAALVEPGAVVVTARVQRQVAGLFVANERGSYQLEGVPGEVRLYRIARATGGHPRLNYYQLIARTVKGLDKNNAQARNTVYQRARKALVAQLRFNQPALSNADIAKERLVLEEAIRKVEAEAARNSRTETPTESRSPVRPAGATDSGVQAASGPRRRNRANPSPADVPWASWPTAEVADAREKLLSGQSSLKKQAVKRFRDVDDFGTATAEAANQKRDAYDEEAPQYPAEEPAASSRNFEPHLDAEDVNSVDDENWQERLERAYEPEEEQPRALPLVRHRARSTAPAEEYERTRRPFSYGGLVRLVAVLIILAGVVGMASRQWSAITEFYQFLNQTGWTPQTPVSRKQSKISGRIPQEQGAGQVPRAQVPGAQTTSAVAQQVVLHEEDGKDQQGRRYLGSAIWRTETVSAGAGLAPEIAVLADAEVPERRMTVAWSLRRNTDKALPASHTIEIKFNLPADFPGGGIANVPGILMAEADQVRGSPLSGLAVKMTDGFYVIGLSAVDPDMQLNEQLLKGRSWFYIPIVYTNGGRAILAMEKGPPGDRAFTEAFAAWEKNKE
jgi:class 3 adenylate cyclase